MDSPHGCPQPVGAAERAGAAAIFSVSYALLSGNRLYLGGKLAENQFLELNLGTCVVDVDPYEVTVGIVVKHHTLRDFAALNALLF